MALATQNLDKKKIQHIVVVSVAIIAIIGLGYYTFGKDTSDERNDQEVIVGGEAQRLNFGVPQTGENEEITKSQAYEKRFNDSIEKIKQAESSDIMFSNSPNTTYRSNSSSQAQGYENINTNYASPKSKSNSNSHNPYGNSSMWTVDEPSNSNIGYSNINTSPPKPKKSYPKQTTTAEDFGFESLDDPHTKYKAVTTNPSPNYNTSQTISSTPKISSIQEKNTSQISVKLITKGSAKNGQSISFITLENAYLNNTRVPKGTRISGVINLSNSRMNVKFSTIRIKNNIHQVNLTLYGMDGLAGLPYNGESNLKEGKESVYQEASNQIGGGAVGTIIRGVASGFKRNNDNSISLGSEIKAIVVNENK